MENSREIEKKVLLLHAGQTKAGSTAIQNYLYDQRNNLLDEGVLFPKSVFCRRNPYDLDRTPGHIAFLEGLSRDDLAEFESEIGSHQFNKMIISIENLFSDQPDSILDKIGAYFKHWDVQLVVILRDFTGWMRSRYIEEVLSGFNVSTKTFSEFCENKLANRDHDYAARIERLLRTTGANQLRLINYDAEMNKEGIVSPFLRKCGLPETNAKLACSIRANVREKFPFLVEGKRRLNLMTKDLPLLDRLDIEAQIRRYAREFDSDIYISNIIDKLQDLPISEEYCNQASNSNSKLISLYSLEPPLTPPTAAKADLWDYRKDLTAANNLLTRGLKFSSKFFRNQSITQNNSFLNIGPLMASFESERLIEFLSVSKFSIHIDSTATALIASSFSGKVIISSNSGASDFSRTLESWSVKMPSEKIDVQSFESFWEIYEEIRNKLRIEVDLIVASDNASRGFIVSCLQNLNMKKFLSYASGQYKILTPTLVVEAGTEKHSVYVRGGR